MLSKKLIKSLRNNLDSDTSRYHSEKYVSFHPTSLYHINEKCKGINLNLDHIALATDAVEGFIEFSNTAAHKVSYLRRIISDSLERSLNEVTDMHELVNAVNIDFFIKYAYYLNWKQVLNLFYFNSENIFSIIKQFEIRFDTHFNGVIKLHSNNNRYRLFLVELLTTQNLSEDVLDFVMQHKIIEQYGSTPHILYNQYFSYSEKIKILEKYKVSHNPIHALKIVIDSTYTKAIVQSFDAKNIEKALSVLGVNDTISNVAILKDAVELLELPSISQSGLQLAKSCILTYLENCIKYVHTQYKELSSNDSSRIIIHAVYSILNNKKVNNDTQFILNVINTLRELTNLEPNTNSSFMIDTVYKIQQILPSMGNITQMYTYTRSNRYRGDNHFNKIIIEELTLLSKISNPKDTNYSMYYHPNANL